MILLEALGLALATELCFFAVSAIAFGISNTVHQVFKNADPFGVQLAVSAVISLSLLTALWSKALKAAGDSQLKRLFWSFGLALLSAGGYYAAQALSVAISPSLIKGEEGVDDGPLVLVCTMLFSGFPALVLLAMFWMCVLLWKRRRRRALGAI
jgi:hypothetical protein